MRRESLHNSLIVRVFCLIATSFLLLPLLVQPVRELIFITKSDEIRNLDSKSEKIERMVFTESEFSKLNFTRSQKEFIYQGNMYDIQSITKSGSKVILLVVWDKPESRILMAFQTEGKPDSSTAPGKIGMGFTPYFHVAAFTMDFYTSWLVRCTREYVQADYIDPYSVVFSPPPELLT